MKKLALGKASVTIEHRSVMDMVWSKKKERPVDVKMPVATTVTVEVAGQSSVGISRCAGGDHFNYEKGRKLALKRAIEGHPDLHDKKDRARIWADYSKLKPGGRW